MKLLEKLQQIDQGLDVWSMEKEGLQKEIELLRGRLDTAQAEITAKQEEVAEIEQEKQVLDENLATESENIARSEVRLKDIKNQKEYQAVSKEIAAAKKMLTELEEQSLQKITRVDELNAEIAGLLENLKSLEENTAAQTSEIMTKVEKVEASITVDMAEREVMVQNLHPSLLNRYNMLRQRRQGLAVVEARNGSCLGCNMNLPPQIYNNLYHAQDLIPCPHCQRLLFMRPQESEQ
jgi:predicted  nucleic acid-binding Zn-ribbon protein